MQTLHATTGPNADVESRAACASCGATLTGPFCARCGEQVVDRHSLTLWHFLSHGLVHLGLPLLVIQIVYLNRALLRFYYEDRYQKVKWWSRLRGGRSHRARPRVIATAPARSV